MDRKEFLNELTKQYAKETLEKNNKYTDEYNEKKKGASIFRHALLKDKYIFATGIASIIAITSIVLPALFPIEGIVISFFTNFVPAVCVPMSFAGVIIGACALADKIRRVVKKVDAKYYEYLKLENVSKPKTEEEKIAAYLENKMEMARLKNKTLALSSSWKRSSDNVVLLYNLSIESTKEDESNQIIENMTQNLEKENEKLEQISLKNALNNALSSEEDDKNFMLVFGMFPFLFSIAVFPSLLSAGTIVATIGVGLAFSGSFINYTSKKTNKAVGNVLKKYNWTKQDMNKLPNESVDDVIKKIIAYDSTIYTKSVLKELNDFSRNNQGIMKSQNKANTLEDIKVPDAILEQMVEPTVVYEAEKRLKK